MTLEQQAAERDYKHNPLWSFVVVATETSEIPVLNFPFVACFYSVETRRKLALKSLWRFLPFYTPSAVKDNRQGYLHRIKGLLLEALCSAAPLR